MKYLFAFFIQFTLFQSYAQDLIGSAGGTGSNASHTLTWSVGEPMTEGFLNGTNRLTQGLLQPQLSFVTEIDELGETWDLSIYPNPTATSLLIHTSSTFERADFILTDLKGTVIQKGQIQNKETLLDCGSLEASTYLLQILLPNKKHKTFKVTKI